MNARRLFLQMMRERRSFARGSLDHEWRTAAARKYVWIMRGKPTAEWN